MELWIRRDCPMYITSVPGWFSVASGVVQRHVRTHCDSSIDVTRMDVESQSPLPIPPCRCPLSAAAEWIAAWYLASTGVAA